MADLLDSVRKQIDARLRELRPIVEEAATLEAALAALDGSDHMVGASQPARPSRGRRTRRPGRPSRGWTRVQLVDHLRDNPGSTAGDVAKSLGLKRTSVATRLPQLVKSGDLVKAARGYSVP
jgi:hypothetical protein